MTVPSLRRVRRFALLLGAVAVCSGYGAAGASASISGPQPSTAGEERARAREEHIQAREERREQHREERANRRGASDECTVTMSFASERIVIGEAVGVSGELSCPEGEQAAEKAVTVYGAGRVALASATTTPDGGYELTVSGVERNTLLSVHAGRARSARLPVKVAPLVTISGPVSAGQAAVHGRGRNDSRAPRAAFAGTVDARFAGRRVALQSSYDPADEEWRTVAFGRVDEEGSYTVSHSFRTPGQTWVRAVVHTPRGNVAGISEAIPDDVLATQNANLTIESSAPFLTFGQSVTIHGVAAGPGQTVTLLSMNRGGSPQTVGETSSGESGEYAFVVSPQDEALYEVRDVSANSIELPVHVGFELQLTPLPASATVGQPVTVEGAIAPATPGQSLELEQQYRSGTGFHPIAVGTLEGTSFSLVHTFAVAGSYRLRVRALKSDGLETTASAPFTIQVQPAEG